MSSPFLSECWFLEPGGRVERGGREEFLEQSKIQLEIVSMLVIPDPSFGF